jgi:hypothetical protein
MRRLSATLGALFLAAGCSGDPTGTTPTGQLHFLRAAATAPPLANAADSFWAKKGVDRRIGIYFRPAAGASDSSQLLEFRVPAQALSRKPNGDPIAMGDSVHIFVTVVDPSKFIVAFEPSGLQFSTTSPADLTMDFAEADADLNDDGVVDATDDLLKTQLHLWRQEQAGQPWTLLSTVVDASLEEAETQIFGFTNYALAY